MVWIRIWARIFWLHAVIVSAKSALFTVITSAWSRTPRCVSQNGVTDKLINNKKNIDKKIARNKILALICVSQHGVWFRAVLASMESDSAECYPARSLTPHLLLLFREYLREQLNYLQNHFSLSIRWVLLLPIKRVNKSCDTVPLTNSI